MLPLPTLLLSKIQTHQLLLYYFFNKILLSTFTYLGWATFCRLITESLGWAVINVVAIAQLRGPTQPKIFGIGLTSLARVSLSGFSKSLELHNLSLSL